MEIVKVVIHSRLGSKQFDNQFCYAVGSGALEATSDATINSAIFGSPTTDFWNVWDPTDSDYPDPATPLQALVAFITSLRMITISIVGATVSDGQRGTVKFRPVAINQIGKRTPGSGGALAVAPGNIIWDIVKVPAVMGINFGHLELRGALLDGDIQMAGADLLDWNDASTQASYNTDLQAALDASHLRDYLFLEAGGDAGWNLAIPRAYPAAHVEAGGWYDAKPIVSMEPGYPRSRQVHRGRKRKVVTPP